MPRYDTRLPDTVRQAHGITRPARPTPLPRLKRGASIPKWIERNKKAGVIYERVAAHLARLHILDEIDEYVIANYAALQAYFIESMANPKGPHKIEPAVLTALRQYSFMLGLDPVSRSRMTSGTGRGEDDETMDELRHRG